MYAHVLFFTGHYHFAGRSPTDISTQNGNDFSLTRDRDLKVKHFWSPSPSLPLPKAFSPYGRRVYVLSSFPPHVCSHLAGQDLGPWNITKLFAQSAPNLDSDNPNRGLHSSLMPQNTWWPPQSGLETCWIMGICESLLKQSLRVKLDPLTGCSAWLISWFGEDGSPQENLSCWHTGEATLHSFS